MTRQNQEERRRFRNKSLIKDLSLPVVFYVFLLILVLLGIVTSPLVLLLMGLVAVLTLLMMFLSSSVKYRTESGIMFVFGKNYIAKDDMELKVWNILKKWDVVLQYDQEGTLNRQISNLKIVVLDGDDSPALFTYLNVLYVRMNDFETNEFERILHHYVANKVFPSFSYSFRNSILRKFNIL